MVTHHSFINSFIPLFIYSALIFAYLILCLLESSGDHNLLKDGPLQGPDLAVRDGLDGGRPLAVVEDGELPEGLADAQAAQHLPLLDHLEFSLARHVQVGPAVTCTRIPLSIS